MKRDTTSQKYIRSFGILTVMSTLLQPVRTHAESAAHNERSVAYAADSSTMDLSRDLTTQVTHVRTGSVKLIASPSRITKVYVGDPAIVEAYVPNPKEVVLNAKAPGLTSVVLWDEQGKQHVLSVSVDVSVEELDAVLHSAFPLYDIRAEVAQDKIILTGVVGSRQTADQVLKLVGQFAKCVVDSLTINSARVPQVELKVRFVEIDRSKLSQFGINIFGPGGGSAIGGASTGQFPSSVSVSSGSGGASGAGSTLSNGSALTVSNPLDLLFYSAKLGTAVTIEDLESKQLAQILAEPTLTTMSGQSASLLAGGEFPFPVVQANTGAAASITIQFRPYGVKLEVTPCVNPDRTVELKVRPEVSSLDYTNAVTISGFTIPAISTKTVDTELVLRSGQSFAISGLLNKQTIDSLSRIPGLSNVPYLGALFRSKATTLSTSELVIIVTPRIIDPVNAETSPQEPVVVRPLLDTSRFDRDIQKKSPAEINR